MCDVMFMQITYIISGSVRPELLVRFARRLLVTTRCSHRHPSPGLGGCSDPLRRLVLCLRLDAWAESSLLRFLHTCCLMRQLLGSRMRAQTPSALWLCPSRGAGGLCAQHPASKETKAGPHMLLHQWVPPIPYCPPRPTLPLICPVGQEAQVWAGQPPPSGGSNRAGADGQRAAQATPGAMVAEGKGPGSTRSPAWGGFSVTLGLSADLLTE